MVKTPFKLTFSEYLEYDDGTDNRYELVEGRLIKMPPESIENYLIAQFLGRKLEAFVGMQRVILQGLELAVPTFPGMPLNRQPDLTAIALEHIQQMKEIGKAAITLDMFPPLLVVEVVSPGEQNAQRDYVDKRSQYQARKIPEYWIVDPSKNQVTVLSLRNGTYQETEFTDNQQIVSPTFPKLKLKVAEVFSVS